jgi:hypothetical protein
MRMATKDHERTRLIATGAGILLGVGMLVCAALIGWRHLPGLAGEWLGVVIGVMTTPFFMEASFALLGLTLVLFLNHWRQKKSGEELVYLEQVVEPAGLPEHAGWAVYREQPLPAGQPAPLLRAEGALAIGDHASAGEFLAMLSEEELARPEALAVRLQLAKATGKTELATRLARQLDDDPSTAG